MWWMRLWLLKLSLLVSLLVLGGGLLLRDADRKDAQHRDEQLARSQQALELLLQVQAEQLIEQATVLASDSTLVSSLEEHERGLAEPALLRLSIQKRLRKLLPPRELGLAMLLDRDGVVLSRVGLEEARHGESLAGWPLVQLGLRGYRLDDLLEHRGQLFEVAVAPLTTQSHDRYAGVLVIGRPLDEKLGMKLGLSVAWRRGGQLLPGQGAGPKAGETVFAVSRPGSVAGVELVSWQPSHTESLRTRLLRIAAAGLPSSWLLFGVLGSALLLGMGLLFLSFARVHSEPAPSPVAMESPIAAVAIPAVVDSEPSGDLGRMYADFVAAKVGCGESLAGLSYETFCDEILGGKESITRDQGCRDVYFRVYVKEGRATLRATPVW